MAWRYSWISWFLATEGHGTPWNTDGQRAAGLDKLLLSNNQWCAVTFNNSKDPADLWSSGEWLGARPGLMILAGSTNPKMQISNNRVPRRLASCLLAIGPLAGGVW